MLYCYTALLFCRTWLRVGIGIPKDRTEDRVSKFSPSNMQAVFIRDHPDFLIKCYGKMKLVDTVAELGIPVLFLGESSQPEEAGMQATRM